MRTLPKKLKLQHFKDVYILNKPESFSAIFDEVNYSESLVTTSCVDCALVFVDTKEEFVNQMLTLFPRLLDSSILWVFYPNETTISEISKLHIEFDWDFLGDYRLKPTKLLSVDDTWNAIKIKKILI
ncbi:MULTISPECIES: hypothetical protein [Aestuariibaculum]|uniref:Uncharacterized protein n=1 Tax=Aestuariibaculum marinum TaxID=2683592 RepID=A0A8J6Q0J2_9FLAO|nr:MULTISPECIES: hypothetical protein [Aestuariibaculum]MBD0825421.1 hypothetical protein [Aestuariibaculum marinum]WMI65880.1 hypothetical protein RBH94_01655 [Aestuariibaculum sp. YM273]